MINRAGFVRLGLTAFLDEQFIRAVAVESQNKPLLGFNGSAADGRSESLAYRMAWHDAIHREIEAILGHFNASVQVTPEAAPARCALLPMPPTPPPSRLPKPPDFDAVAERDKQAAVAVRGQEQPAAALGGEHGVPAEGMVVEQ